MITVKVKGNRIIPEVIHPGTAGSYRERITLDLSEEWSDLLCKIDFYPIKGKPVSIVWGDEEKKNGVKVPLEVMKYSGMADYVVSGFIMDGDNLGEKLISVTGHMKISATRGEANNAVNPEAPTPNVYEQLRDSMIRDIDAALREAKESGEFDGKSPYIGSNGNWWIGDKDTGVKANISAQAVLFSPQLLSESEKTTARKNIDAPDCVITSAEGDTFTVTNALDRRLRGLSVYGRSEVSEDISPDDIHINTPIPGINSIGEKGSISVSVGSTNLRIPIGDSVIGIAADGLLGVTESGDEIKETYTDKNGQRWVSDEIDFSRGVYIQRIGKIVFGENTNVETEGRANTYSIELSSLGMGLPKNGANCLCNIFTGDPVDGFLGTGDHFVSVVDTKVYIHSSRYENGGAEEMKSHFASLARAGTPVLLYYVLDRPVEIPLTEFLTENVRKLALQKGECAATTDEGAWIKIEYAADIKQYIDEKLSGGTGGETDPTVPDWAKQPDKPTYTADEVGARPSNWMPSASDVGALPADTKIPTKTSDLSNNSGFITRLVKDLVNYYTTDQTYTKDEVNNLVSAIPKFTISVVTTLPSVGISETTVYLLKAGNVSGDLYTEYIFANGAWEILGSQRVDLTGYATETWVNGQLSKYLLETDLTIAINLALANAKASGEFDGDDGVSPDVSLVEHSITDGGGVSITVTNPDGTTSTARLYDGKNGTNGTSVTVSKVTESTASGGTNVVTFSNGTTLNVKNGKDGESSGGGDAVFLGNVCFAQDLVGFVLTLNDDVRNYRRLLITMKFNQISDPTSAHLVFYNYNTGTLLGEFANVTGLFETGVETTLYVDVEFFANSAIVRASKNGVMMRDSDEVYSYVANLSDDFVTVGANAIRFSGCNMGEGSCIKVEGVPK